MQYEVATPSEYISQLDDDWRRETLEELRAIIKDTAPRLEERIHYKMLGYGIGDNHVFHLNAQRGYVSLYVGDTRKIDPKGVWLKGLNLGKGCIRFTKSRKVAETDIDKFITAAVTKWQNGEDIEC